MNTVVLSGRLVADPELRRTDAGNSLASFCIAVRTSAEKTNFLDCVAVQQLADLIVRNVSKGEKITVMGSLNQRNYQGSDGKMRQKIEVFVKEAEFQLKLNEVAVEEPQEEPKPKTKKTTKKA